MDQQIIYYYRRGIASYLIAKKLGVSNTKVRGILKKHGISLRDHAVTNKISAARRTPTENRAITKKAAQANLGSTHSNWHRVKLAASRQLRPQIDDTYEQPLIDECKRQGILAIPQKAFYKYNVDLYIPSKNVVIELFGGNFHNKPQAVQLFRNKLNYLSSNNIPVVVVWCDKLTFSPPAILQVALNAKNPLTNIEGSGICSTRTIL